MRDVEHARGEFLEGTAAWAARGEPKLRHLFADAVMILDRPVPDLVPRGIQRLVVIEQADPESGQRADAVPRAAVGPAHLQEALEPDFRKGGREMVGPVAQSRALSGQNGQVAGQEIAKAEPGGVDVAALAEHEIHRHVEHVVGIAFIAEAILEHERQHAGARGIGIGPDMAAIGQEAVGPALGKGGVGEQRGGERLQREAEPELADHVRLARIIEIGLDGAGAQHHVEAERADARHVPQHDLVPALGHDRQVGAGLVRPEAQAEKAHAQLLANLLHLGEVPSGFGAGLVEIIKRRPGQFELSGGLEADIAVRPGQRDDILALVDRLPPELGEPDEERVDAALLLVGRRVMIADRVDEFLVFGADPPARLRLLAVREDSQQVVTAFDQRVGAGLCRARGHGRRR
jgi:hypothetical protein